MRRTITYTLLRMTPTPPGNLYPYVAEWVTGLTREEVLALRGARFVEKGLGEPVHHEPDRPRKGRDHASRSIEGPKRKTFARSKATSAISVTWRPWIATP